MLTLNQAPRFNAFVVSTRKLNNNSKKLTLIEYNQA